MTHITCGDQECEYCYPRDGAERTPAVPTPVLGHDVLYDKTGRKVALVFGRAAEDALRHERTQHWTTEGAEPGSITPTEDEQTVTIDADDRVELYWMLHGRGGSALKTKLLRALVKLDPERAAELTAQEETSIDQCEVCAHFSHDVGPLSEREGYAAICDECAGNV